MGTETKFNCYTENNTSNGDGIISKACNGSNSSAGIVSTTASGQKSYANGHNNGLANGKQNGTTTTTTTTANDTTTAVEAQPPFIPIHIDEHNVVEGAKEILKVIRPDWELQAVQFKTFTDGITNKLVGCFYKPPSPHNGKCTNGISYTNGNKSNGHHTSNGNSHFDSDCTDFTTESTANGSPTAAAAAPTDNVVLVRVYGNKTDLLIDRNAEKRNILLLHSYGFAPSLYAVFKNGLAYDYVPGVTLNTSNVLEPEVWRLVARRMAEMHRVVRVRRAGDLAGDSPPAAPMPMPMLWQKTQKFLDLVPERYSDAEKQKRIEETFLPISRMRDEFAALYRHLEALGSPVVFSHNDLLLGNIVYLESQQCVNFIDYEYAAYNFQAFDIGNHFCEFAGVDEVDYARYPTREFQLQWLRVYLQAYLQRSHVTDAEVERLYVQVNQFALAAHFFWIIWSLIQAEHSNIDFDYVDYSLVRYKEYLNRKDEFLALDLNGENGSS